jgi:hypothetical protein
MKRKSRSESKGRKLSVVVRGTRAPTRRVGPMNLISLHFTPETTSPVRGNDKPGRIVNEPGKAPVFVRHDESRMPGHDRSSSATWTPFRAAPVFASTTRPDAPGLVVMRCVEQPEHAPSNSRSAKSRSNFTWHLRPARRSNSRAGRPLTPARCPAGWRSRTATSLYVRVPVPSARSSSFRFPIGRTTRRSCTRPTPPRSKTLQSGPGIAGTIDSRLHS